MGPNAFVADAADLTSNSALTGLTSIGQQATLGVYVGASLAITSPLTNNGNIRLSDDSSDGAPATLQVAGAFGGPGRTDIAFGGGGDEMILDAGSALGQTVSGFGINNAIDLASVAYVADDTVEVVAGGVTTVRVSNGVEIASLTALGAKPGQFGVISDGSGSFGGAGGLLVQQVPVGVKWLDASASWTIGVDWLGGLPTDTSDVIISQGSPQVTAPIAVRSILITDDSDPITGNVAKLSISSAGASTVDGAVTNSGALSVDGPNGSGGPTLSISGLLNNAGNFNLGNYNLRRRPPLPRTRYKTSPTKLGAPALPRVLPRGRSRWATINRAARLRSRRSTSRA